LQLPVLWSMHLKHQKSSSRSHWWKFAPITTLSVANNNSIHLGP